MQKRRALSSGARFWFISTTRISDSSPTDKLYVSIGGVFPGWWKALTRDESVGSHISDSRRK